MGSRLVKFNFTPGENEQIEAIIKVPEEHRSIIHGIVKDHKNRTVKDAVVKLFEVANNQDECMLKPITHTFTDECGQFLFGPLVACKQYVIKVWISNVKIRELTIRPDDCNEQYEDKYKCNMNSAYRSPKGDFRHSCISTYNEYEENNNIEEDE